MKNTFKSIALFAALFISVSSFSQTVVTAGKQVTFSAAVATGTAPFTYQWKKGGTVIAAAPNASSWSIASVASGDAGSYTVTVSNGAGAVTSAAVALTVNAALPSLPVFTIQPLSQSVSVGGSVTFTIDGTGEGVVTLQWKRNGAAISGATANSLALTNVQLSDGGAVFTCVATNAGGSVTSTPATLSVSQVLPAGVTLTITAK